MARRLTHYDKRGRVRMVDVSAKPATVREARAQAVVRMKPAVLRKIRALQVPKGDPLEVARIAGIAAAKRVPDLIPLCHPLQLTYVDVTAQLRKNDVLLTSSVRTTGPTGVEMEALTAVAVGALTVYDMCKALDPGIEVRGLYLLEKSGGKSGPYRRRR